jgi:hypothetical protein
MPTTSSRFAVPLLGGLLIHVSAYAQVELHVLGITQAEPSKQEALNNNY